MNKKILVGIVLLVVISSLIYIYFQKESLSNPSSPKDKEDSKKSEDIEDSANNSEGGTNSGSGSGISGFGTGDSIGGIEGESEQEKDCTGNIGFSTEININNEETTTDDEVILVMQNNDNSVYQNFNVYVDEVFEGTITLNSGGIANIISNEMTSWWQSLDLSQVVSRTFNIKITDEEDCEVTNSVTLDYPYEGAPWD